MRLPAVSSGAVADSLPPSAAPAAVPAREEERYAALARSLRAGRRFGAAQEAERDRAVRAGEHVRSAGATRARSTGTLPVTARTTEAGE